MLVDLRAARHKQCGGAMRECWEKRSERRGMGSAERVSMVGVEGMCQLAWLEEGELMVEHAHQSTSCHDVANTGPWQITREGALLDMPRSILFQLLIRARALPKLHKYTMHPTTAAFFGIDAWVDEASSDLSIDY